MRDSAPFLLGSSTQQPFSGYAQQAATSHGQEDEVPDGTYRASDGLLYPFKGYYLASDGRYYIKRS